MNKVQVVYMPYTLLPGVYVCIYTALHTSTVIHK